MSEELKNCLGIINYEIETSDIELEKLDLGLNAKSWKELLDYINNLQNRIDKAIDLLTTLLLYDTSKRSDAGLILVNANKLIDILKGDDIN